MDVFRARERTAWRAWLEENHDKSTEVWLLFYKKHTGKLSVTYDEAVEEALCYGWIDGIMRRVDDDSYAQKFTPRKAGSGWSASNLTRMKRLIEEGAVSNAGIAAFLGRSKERPDAGRLKTRTTRVPEDLEAKLKGSARAWKNFQGLPPSHRSRYILWIVGAKRPETRKRRVAEAVRLIEKSTDEFPE